MFGWTGVTTWPNRSVVHRRKDEGMGMHLGRAFTCIQCGKISKKAFLGAIRLGRDCIVQLDYISTTNVLPSRALASDHALFCSDAR
jgi:hypothetical protein